MTLSAIEIRVTSVGTMSFRPHGSEAPFATVTGEYVHEAFGAGWVNIYPTYVIGNLGEVQFRYSAEQLTQKQLYRLETTGKCYIVHQDGSFDERDVIPNIAEYF